MNQDVTTVDEKNRWRLETPGHQGWERTARPDDPRKYLMISADCHCNEPSNLWWTRIDKKFQPRLPHVEVDEKGEKWMVVEGYQRSRLRARNVADAPKGGEDRLRGEAGRTVQDRIADIFATELMLKFFFRTRAWQCGRPRTLNSAQPNAVPGTTGLGKPSAHTTISCRPSPQS
jgi:hypothetical protein